MPISLHPFTLGTLCFGNKWEITNQPMLEKIVAKVLLGRIDHAEKILKGLNIPSSSRNINCAIDDAIKKLTYTNDQQQYHRDGLIFQIISWVAAHKNITGISVIADPHIIPAQKGFDGLQIDIASNNENIKSVIIFEDKATTQPRNKITSQVWPEFKSFYDGERSSELDNALTSLLKNRSDIINDLDQAIESVMWNEIRKFRVSVTTNNTHNTIQAISSLFNDYDTKIPGDISLRQAEYICFNNLRDWMDTLSTNIIIILESRKINV